MPTETRTTAEWDRLLEKTQEDCFWCPPEIGIVDRPELMVLHADRDVQYLNAVLRVRGDETTLPALVKEVSALHEGVRSRWMLTPNNRSDVLEDLLREEGYQPIHEHFGYVKSVHEFTPTFSPHLFWKQVETLQDLRDCEEVALRSFASATPLTEEELERDLAYCVGQNARVLRVVVYDKETGAPVSSGGVNLHPELRFGFLWAGCTVPEARRRGAYTAALSARFVLAKERGLEALGLYARVGTSAPIVAAQGFLPCGPMVQWDRPAR